MHSHEFEFADGTTGLLVKDNESDRLTLVLTKTVQGREINFALDFEDSREEAKFGAWLSRLV